MGYFKICIQTSVILALYRKKFIKIDSQYFYIICQISEFNPKLIDKKLAQMCKESQLSNSKEEKIKNQKNKDNKRNVISSQEEQIICRDIMSMDMNNKMVNKTDMENYILIPLNILNIASLGILFVLILFGSYYIWMICTRKKCSCKVCKGEYRLIEKLGEGGFGEVSYNFFKN